MIRAPIWESNTHKSPTVSQSKPSTVDLWVSLSYWSQQLDLVWNTIYRYLTVQVFWNWSWIFCHLKAMDDRTIMHLQSYGITRCIHFCILMKHVLSMYHKVHTKNHTPTHSDSATIVDHKGWNVVSTDVLIESDIELANNGIWVDGYLQKTVSQIFRHRRSFPGHKTTKQLNISKTHRTSVLTFHEC